MLTRIFHNWRPSSAVVRLRVQGPLNTTSQFEINQKINRIQHFRSNALLVVINSYGGSLQSAKNISARLKKYSLNKKIPVYCFAQQFCLNSANLILTTGTKCFAHKFSTIGDFGYVYEGLDTQGFQNTFKIGQNHISSGKKTYSRNLFDKNGIPSDKELIQKVLNQSAENLRKQIFLNRQNSLTKVQQQQFIKSIDQNQGFVDVQKSVNLGLVDGVIGVELVQSKSQNINQSINQQKINTEIQKVQVFQVFDFNLQQVKIILSKYFFFQYLTSNLEIIYFLQSYIKTFSFRDKMMNQQITMDFEFEAKRILEMEKSVRQYSKNQLQEILKVCTTKQLRYLRNPIQERLSSLQIRQILQGVQYQLQNAYRLSLANKDNVAHIEKHLTKDNQKLPSKLQVVNWILFFLGIGVSIIGGLDYFFFQQKYSLYWGLAILLIVCSIIIIQIINLCCCKKNYQPLPIIIVDKISEKKQQMNIEM